MRRKSTRNAQKATPDKLAKESETPTPPPKTRRSRRRKRSPSKSSDSEEEVVTVTKRAAPEQTPDTTTKSHPPSDEEAAEEPVWKVTAAENAAPKGGEIQKLKICLTRPSPDSPEKVGKSRSKSNSQTEDDATSSEDKSATRKTRSSRGSPSHVRNDGLSSQEGDEDAEDKKGKGKSKGKHKSKIEKSPHLSETERQTNNEISENVQVTPQSPSIDKPVDNENDRKVDVDDIQNVSESAENAEEPVVVVAVSDDTTKDVPENDSCNSKTRQRDSDDDDDDEPLSVVRKHTNENNKSATITPEDTITGQETVQPNESTSQEEPAAAAEQEKPTEEENKHESVTKEPEASKVQQPEEQPQVDVEPPQTEVETEIEQERTVEGESEKEKPVEGEADKDTSLESGEVTQSDTSDPKISTVIAASDETASTPTSEEKQEKPKADRAPFRRLKRNVEYPGPDSKAPEEESGDGGHIKPSKTKRTWTNDSDVQSTRLVIVDLDSIQSVWPTIDFPEEPDLHLEIEKERRKSVTEPPAKKPERKVSVEYKSDFERPSFDKQSSVNSTTTEGEDNSNIIAFNRKISIVDDTASKLKPPPSPAKNPTTNILFITNLVRPFTVKQLKELLERTGKIQEEGFWTDRIKSKCYVQYDTQEEAEATRNALHGVQWPIGNGKKLMIDYATEEDMQNAKNPPAPPPPAPVEETKAAAKENVEPMEVKSRPEEKIPKEAEKKRPEVHVREWDIGKKDVRRERSRSRERGRKHRRSPSPHEDFISRKQRKAEEAVPQKLMDDLFLKTKATPSIYWQPLSPEEISMKQQQRLIRMEEHKRRMEENSRMKGGREMGRGAFRRRYD